MHSDTIQTAAKPPAPPLPPGFVMPEIQYILRDRIRAFADQPRTHFELNGPDGLIKLGENIKEHGQTTPALAIRLPSPIGTCDFELIDGERRWRACELSEVPYFLILINPNIKSKDDQYVQSVVANFFRVPPNDVESARSIDRMKKMGMSNEIIAEKMGKSTTWAYQHHSLLRLHPEVLKLIIPPTPPKQRIPYLNALELVELSFEEQLRLATTMSVERTSRAKTKLLVRKSATQSGTVQKLKLPKKAFTELRTLVRKANEGVETTLDQPNGFFEQVIRGAKPEEIRKLIMDFDDLISGLGMLKEEVVRKSKS